MTVTINGSSGLTANNGSVFTDSTGNVGVGTSTPDVFSRGYGRILGLSSASSAAIEVSAATGNNAVIDLGVNGTRSLSITTDGSTPYINSIGALPIGFATNGTERARIDSSGNLLVNTTAASYGEKFKTVNSGSSANVALFYFNGAQDRTNVICQHANATGASAGTQIDFLNAAGSSVGSIRSNTSLTAYNTTSDYRLKENVQPMTDALQKVSQLKPCTYTWKANNVPGQGFIAHELQAIFPDAVSGEKDAVNEDGTPKYQGIDTSFLVATLTAAIQELKAELDTVKAELAALKGA